jgi:hypothetical protein
MKTVKGTLTQGIEFDGKTHVDYEIRTGTIGDLVELYDTPMAERASKNFYFQQTALTALRLVKLGGIPKDRITPELLLTLSETDMSALMAAANQRGADFRKTEGNLEVNLGTPKTGLQPSRSPDTTGSGD